MIGVMATSYSVFFDRAALPAFEAVRAMAHYLEADFDFAEAYDFRSESGYCPCRLAGADCGFEWRLAANAVDPDRLVDAPALRQPDSRGELIFHENFDNAICAVVVAAAIALLTGGALLTPDEALIVGDDLPDWAQGEANGYRFFRPGDGGLADAEALLGDWLRGVRDARAQLLPRFDPGSPRIIITFSSGVRLIGARWTLRLADGSVATTHAYPPRNPSDDDIAALQRQIEMLTSLLQNRTVDAARFDAASLEIHLAFAGGGLIFHPRAAYPSAGWNKPLMLGDCWEMLDNRLVRITPDADSGTLRLDSD